MPVYGKKNIPNNVIMRILATVHALREGFCCLVDGGEEVEVFATDELCEDAGVFEEEVPA